MSLINDALRRAKAAQEQNAPAPLPELRFRQPVTPSSGRQGSPWLLAGIACAVAAFAAIVALALQKTSSPMRAAAAPALAPSENQQTPSHPEADRTEGWDKQEPAKVTSETGSGKQVASSQAQETVAGIRESHPANPSETGRASAGLLRQEAGQQESTASLAVEPVAVAPPKPPEPKLQGIFFNPARPSAMINGRTLFVGDKVGELKVIAIDQESATLAGAGETNILKMEQ